MHQKQFYFLQSTIRSNLEYNQNKGLDNYLSKIKKLKELI